MAKFEKGKSGNPNGRAKGAVNKVTAEVRDTIKTALSGVTADVLAEKLHGLHGKDYIDAYTKLAEFVTPKLARTQLAGDDGDGGGRVTVTLNLGSPAPPPSDAR